MLEKQLILTVDDDMDILRTNKKFLEARGYVVHKAECAGVALKQLEKHKYSCILLDVMLPDMDGFELCRAIRRLSDAPVLFVSCLDGEEEKINGLMSGGDDYIVKPYSLKELAARIHAQVRRTECKNLFVDRESQMIMSNGRAISFSEKEFLLFMHFFTNPDVIFSPDALYLALWGKNNNDMTNTIAVYIRRVREKLVGFEKHIGEIETIRGEGYCFRSKASQLMHH